MSSWPDDIRQMHDKFQHTEAIEKLPKELLLEFLRFRIKFLEEEMAELKSGTSPEDVVDALIDLCVVAIGTMDLLKIDSQKAWDEVLKANFKKQSGKNDTRPSKFDLPDLVKPSDWVAPNHSNNVGSLSAAFIQEETK